MKFYVVLMFLLVSLFSKAQSDSAKSLVVQRVDSVSLQRIVEIETNLTKFHHVMRNSQILMFLGSVISAGSFVLTSQQVKIPFILPAIGAVSTLAGFVVYLDSYKYLNYARKKKKVIPSKDPNYNF